jgi:hypothetical protein
MFTGAVHLKESELEHMRRQIARGLLPPDAIERHFEDERKAVFGENYKRDANGNPIEQGIGSAANPSRQSIEAYRRYGKSEPAFEENLLKMEQQLADHLAAQAKQRRRNAQVAR